MRIAVIDTEAGLHAWEEPWKHAYLESGTDNIFLSWEWMLLWCRHYGAGHAIRVVAVEDGTGLIGIAPLVATRGHAGSLYRLTVHFPGDEKLADYTDILVVRDGEAVIRAVLDTVREWGDWGRIIFQRVPDGSPGCAAMRRLLERENRPGSVRLACRSPYLTIAGTWDAYFASRSKAVRQELRTSGNHLSRMGAWGLQIARGAHLPAAREALYALHIKRQTHRPGTSIFSDAAGRAFTQDLTESSPAGWGAEVSTLQVGGRTVSAVLALRGKRTFYYWVPAFDSTIRSVSLGKFHLKLLVEHAFAEGYATVDLMIGDDQYKREWASEMRSSWHFVTYRDRATAALAKRATKLWSALRRVKGNSPTAQRLWTRLSKLLS